MDDKKELWEKCVAFHGHVCGGLTIGYKASLYAMELLGLGRSADEEIVCIAENDACGIDAVQVVLGCTVGKGNLLFHICGKQAFSVYDRKSGRSLRLVLKPLPEGMMRAQSLPYLTEREPKELFEVKETTIELPERASVFESFLCENCGESTGIGWLRLVGGKKLCPDCGKTCDRFRV